MRGKITSIVFVVATMAGAYALAGCASARAPDIGPTLTAAIKTQIELSTAIAGVTQPVQPAATETATPTLAPTATTQAPTQTLEPTPTATATATRARPTAAPSDQPTVFAPRPTATRLPGGTPLPPADLPGGEIVFTDDFEASEAWYTTDGNDIHYRYESGAYLMTNNLAQAAVHSVRSQVYTHAFIEVDAAPVDGPDNGYYGAICRYKDPTHYYAFVIGADGFYGIVKMEEGVLTFLVVGPPAAEGTPQPELFDPTETNRVGASCIGDRLVLFVNGKLLLETRDSAYASGQAGLLVGTRERGGVEARFDNYQILVPDS